MAHYRISSRRDNGIVAIYEMARERPDGEIESFIVTDRHLTGFGFISSKEDLPEDGDDKAYCEMFSGEEECCEFEGSESCTYEFSENVSKSDRAAIIEAYKQGGAGWLFDGDHDWDEENILVIVEAPYKIDFCEADGTVIDSIS